MVTAFLAIGVGAAMGVAIAAPVGPVAALCVERTFARGLGVALVTALGAGLADGAFGAIAAFGVGFVTDWVQSHEVHLRVLGAIVLTALAVQAWRKRKTLEIREPERVSAGAMLGALSSGFLLTASSPVTIVTFAVALASFGGELRAGLRGCTTWVPVGVSIGSAGWYGALSAVAYAFRDAFRDAVGSRRRRMDRVGLASAIFLAACAVLSLALALRAC